MKPIDCFPKDVEIKCKKEWKIYKDKDCVIAKCKYTDKRKGCWFVLFKYGDNYSAFYITKDGLYCNDTKYWNPKEILKSYKDSFYEKDEKLYEEFMGSIVLDGI